MPNMLVLILSVIVCLREVLPEPLVKNSFYGAKSLSLFELENPSLVDSIASGTELAIHHCQFLFQWDRWNCPKTVFSRQQRFHPTRETAFSKAIIAAGITYSLTRNCSKGAIKGCGCSYTDKHHIQSSPESLKNQHIEVPPRNQDLNNKKNIQQQWGGCSDDTSFASDMTKQFLNSLDKGLDASAYVIRHNYKIGIQVVQNAKVKKCRCHGISGSCSLQTCWVEVAPFGEISKKLKDLHRRALRVTYNDVQESIIMGNSAREDAVEEKEIAGTKNSLIYLEQSPDYCLPNLMEGFTGTKGRTCSKNKSNVTKSEKNSCRHLCKKCGHHVKRLQKKVTRRCNCTFTWCCEVKCDTCVEDVDEHFCV